MRGRRRRALRFFPELALTATVTAVALGGQEQIAWAQCAQGRASAAYVSARKAFEDKRFDDSIALLREAYACEPRPVYLGNVARAYEEANRPRDALGAWRAYLSTVTDERERRSTEGRISALSKLVSDLDQLQHEKETAEEGRRRAEEAAREAPLPPRSPAADGHTGPRVAAPAWVVAGAGVAGVAAGVACGLVALSKHDAAVDDPSVDAAESTQRSARTFAQSANWLFGVGGAVAAAGAVWISIDLLRPRSLAAPAPASATLLLSASGVGWSAVF